MNTKKFKEADNTAVFTTKFVIIDKRDIIYVTHDEEDGSWQFLSNDHFDNFEEVAKVVGLGEIINMDNSILELAEMPVGYVATRKFKGDNWQIKKHE